ncbi:hypothetical protein ACFY4C_31995 [Actinomadura viridis]|uniref:hypothetical protein n=1 Tax=Actinomadura viridis TaxID=58110 RepID=UPI00369AFB4E
MALVNALTSSSGSKDPGPAGGAAGTGDLGGVESTPSAPSAPRSSQPPRTAAASATPLRIRVTGAPTTVYVRVSNGGEVLQQGVLSTGEERMYEQAPLSVVAANGGSLEVVIYGRTQQRKPAGTRAEWFVPER